MRRLILWSVLAVFSTAMLGAQTPDQGPGSVPPPPPNQAADNSIPPESNSAVARVSVISGTVSTQRGDTGEWDAAALNSALVSGDKISTGDDGRTEVQLDYANVLRLSNGSQANLVSVTNNQFQIQLATGLADYVVLKGAQATAEIDTPNVAVHPNGPGVFRIQVNSDSETRVIVREGEADISTPQGSTPLKKGEEITVQGTDAPEYKIADAPGQDDWDHWNKDRNTHLNVAEAYNHTNRYYTGAGDLDNYGYWTDVPGYGEVWVPNENASWTPYSDGRWDWEPYWGWTWVGYEPWGWAPYHYGRWFPYRDRWVWWPGPVTPYYRPVWAPAYVSFFGWGGGFGVSIGFGGGWGSIGWLPIGPCDAFHPWWGGEGFRRGFDHGFENGRIFAPLATVGRGRVVYSNLANLNRNEIVRRGLIRVPSSDFGRGVMSARQHVNAVDLRQSQPIRGSLGVAPTRGAMSATHRLAGPDAVPQRTATHFFGSTARASSQSRFSQERSGMQEPVRQGSNGMTRFTPAGNGVNGGQSMRGGETMRGGGVESRGSSPAPANANQPRNGWQRFNGGAGAEGGGAIRGGSPALRGGGESIRSGATVRGGAVESRGMSPAPANATQPRSGWQRFNGGAEAVGGGAIRGGGPAPRGGSSVRGGESAPVERGGAPGWGRFSPQQEGGYQGRQESVPSSPESRRGGYSAPQRSYGESRGGGGAVSRPPLEVGHPVVRESAPAYRGGGGGGEYRSSGGGRPSGGGGARPSGGGGSRPSGHGGGHGR